MAHVHAVPAADDLLTAQEEIQLAQEIEAGVLAAEALDRGERPHRASVEELRCLAAAGERAGHRYVRANLRLVSMVARQAAARSGLSEADLFQEGCLGLITAIHRYDFRRGCRFSTYALSWIRAFVGAASARQLGTMNLPASRAAQLRHARGIEALLAQELGRQPMPAEVAAALGRPVDWTLRLLAYELPRALDEIGDIEADGCELEALMVGLEPMPDLLGQLDGFERRVLELLLGFAGEPLSYASVARALNVSANRVRRAEGRALDRLRDVCPQAARERLAG